MSAVLNRKPKEFKIVAGRWCDISKLVQQGHEANENELNELTPIFWLVVTERKRFVTKGSRKERVATIGDN